MPYGHIIPQAAAVYRAAKRARTVYNAVSGYAGPLSTRWMGKKGTGGGRRKVRGSRTKFARAVRKVIFSTAEKCYKSIAKDGNTFNHDTMNVVQLWSPSSTALFPSQGSSDGERRGDEIYSTGIMMRAIFQIPQDRRNTKFRMWWVTYDENQQGILNKANFFHNVSNNVMIDPVQTDKWRGCIKYLGTYRVSATDQTTGTSDKTVFVKKWLPFRSKVTFQSDTSTVPASGIKPYGALVVAPYDNIASLQTDTLITNSEITFTLYYKDP